MSTAVEERPKTDKTTAKFIQIASGQPYGQGLTLFALDEDGGVWQIIVGRDEASGLYLFPDRPETLEALRQLRDGQVTELRG